MLSSLHPSPAPVRAVLNYMGFEAGPTRLPLIASSPLEAKRIVKVVVDGDYHDEIVQEFFVRIIDVLDS